MTPFDDCLTIYADGARLTLRARPGINKPRPPRLVALADGKRAVELTVAAVAEDGKANDALLAQLAKNLGLKKAQLSVKSGASGKLKIIDIHGAPEALGPLLTAWLTSLAAAANGK